MKLIFYDIHEKKIENCVFLNYNFADKLQSLLASVV